MIERIIENWLDNSSEKTFQKPFCYMLANEGYTIIHLTRHCGMEHGKDIIAINPQGEVCAFQLKGANNGKIKLKQWQDGLLNQTHQLVLSPVAHPSINTSTHHKSYLVTNGEIEEEVFREIDLLNRIWEQRGTPQYKLETKVKGELISMAKKLQLDFFPTELTNVKLLLEFYLEEGTGLLPKEKLSFLLKEVLSKNKKQEIKRAISSAALLCSLASSSYSNKENHVAEIEAWVIYIAEVFAVVEEYSLQPSFYQNEISIAENLIINSLENLLEEAQEKKNLVVGNALADGFVVNARIMWVAGLLSSLGIYYILKGEPKDDNEEKIKKFCLDNIKRFQLWGEAAVPQILSFYWFYSKIDATQKSVRILYSLLNALINANHKNYIGIFPNPYYNFEDSFIMSDPDNKEKKHFKGESHCLEGILHLFVKENYKQQMKILWPSITKIRFTSFEFEKKWHFYNWRNRTGKEKLVQPPLTEDWTNLKAVSFESEGNEIPDTLKKYYYLYPLFLIVYPHRFNSNGIRWFDNILIKAFRPL